MALRLSILYCYYFPVVLVKHRSVHSFNSLLLLLYLGIYRVVAVFRTFNSLLLLPQISNSTSRSPRLKTTFNSLLLLPNFGRFKDCKITIFLSILYCYYDIQPPSGETWLISFNSLLLLLFPRSRHLSSKPHSFNSLLLLHVVYFEISRDAKNNFQFFIVITCL